MRYLVILERGESGYGAYSPDLPGCVATGPTPQDTLGRMRQAISSHLEGLHQDGLPAPEPLSEADYIEVA